jgi:hypothetical protein
MQGIYEWIVTRFDGSELVYVGKSTNIENRRRQYADDWAAKSTARPTNEHLKRAVQKYGNCRFAVLEEVVNEADLTARERYWYLRRVRELGRENVANIIEPGQSPLDDSDVRERCVRAVRERFQDDEVRAAYAERARRLNARADFKAARSAQMQQVNTDPAFQQRRLAGLVQALAKHYVFTSPTGQVTPVYNLKEFCRQHALTYGAMKLVAYGKRRQHKGWTRPEGK